MNGRQFLRARPPERRGARPDARQELHADPVQNRRRKKRRRAAKGYIKIRSVVAEEGDF